MEGSISLQSAVGDLLVVLDLTLVVGEDGSSDLIGRAPAPSPKQRHTHQGLVDVGHPHTILNEIQELFVGHACTVRKLGIRRYRLILPRLRKGVAAERNPTESAVLLALHLPVHQDLHGGAV
jgi:hypothetical protein